MEHCCRNSHYGRQQYDGRWEDDFRTGPSKKRARCIELPWRSAFKMEDFGEVTDDNVGCSRKKESGGGGGLAMTKQQMEKLHVTERNSA
ncbi:hypothetical protein E2562_010651 [Oryza meyeriana var. granulata]|uniref:Uncharacterized protein n=1 Tax=Oryza meyeriana var. granulata TaxID=110450 RepID=A0A6G1EW48_9ORYZ|nr:hypothetical protein E2562_010651 [Oryza meyeriana var. granulata]